MKAGDRVRIRRDCLDAWATQGGARWMAEHRAGTLSPGGLTKGSGRMAYVRWDGNRAATKVPAACLEVVAGEDWAAEPPTTG